MGTKVTAMIMEKGKLTEYSLGTMDELKSKITHNGKKLDLDKDKVLQKIFTERGVGGRAKHCYVFGKLNEELELIGLEEFNPYKAISAEEADIMLHEGVTMRGIRNLVTKVKGKGTTRKFWMLVIMLMVIVSIVYLKVQGMI